MKCIVLTTHMGLRPLAAGRCIKNATAAVCVKQDSNDNIRRGIAILYPDTKRTFFAEEFSTDIEVLWRGMYIASKMMYVGNEAVEMALLIAGETPLSDPRFADAHKYLSYDNRNVETLRKNALAKVIPERDLRKINEALGLAVPQTEDSRPKAANWEETTVKLPHHLRQSKNEQRLAA